MAAYYARLMLASNLHLVLILGADEKLDAPADRNAISGSENQTAVTPYSLGWNVIKHRLRFGNSSGRRNSPVWRNNDYVGISRLL
jgi:hypothetical protein